MKKALFISYYNWYEKRLEPIRNILVKDYEVTILTADFDHNTKNRIKNKISECKYIDVPQYRKNISVKRIYSHLYFGRTVAKYIDQIKPDLIYLIIPPNNVAEYCLKYKKENPNIRYYIDIIDLWPESMPFKRLNKLGILSIWKKLRDNSLSDADYIFTECSLYQKKLGDKINQIKTSTLYLYKEQTKKERELVENIIKKKSETLMEQELSLAYVGSINNIIDIDTISNIISVAITLGFKIRVHVIGDGESREKFLNSLKAAGAEIFYYGCIYEEKKKIEILAECDYGLNIMKEMVSVGLTIKSIDYFSYGLPLLNTIKGDTWMLIDKYQIGKNIEKQNNNYSKKFFFLEKQIRYNILKIFDTYFTKSAFENRIKDVIRI